jgi:HEAT repeat protein
MIGSLTIAGLLIAASASAQTPSDWAAAAAEWRAAAAAALPEAAEWRALAAEVAAGWQLDRDQSQRDRDATERAREAAQRDRDNAQRGRDREVSQYDAGQSSLDAGKWDNAVQHFDAVIDMKGAKADGALYWKAYAQNKLGQRPEALATLGSLTKDYPKSRYLNDAKALEVEVRSGSGRVDPAQESDEDLKLIAIQALQNSDAEQAVPMLQKVLQGTGSPRLKARALFVLAQSNSQKARDVLVSVAKGGSNPDLQMNAIKYLGVHGGKENRAALAEIYGSTSDVDIKKRILSSFMVAGDKERVLSAAQSEQNPELRAEAVRQLGNMGANEELWTLYQKDSSVDVKKQIIRAMFVGGHASRLIELAKAEQNPELRLLAVRNLGIMGSKQTSDALVEIYGTSKDAEIRKAVINSLFIQNNAEGLVALARKESDLTMKKEMVQKISLMKSKVATDYMLEILNGK